VVLHSGCVGRVSTQDALRELPQYVGATGKGYVKCRSKIENVVETARHIEIGNQALLDFPLVSLKVMHFLIHIAGDML
jgi:hypothetical protein